MARKGKITRKTKETSINVEVNIDGKGKYQIDTGFFSFSSYFSFSSHIFLMVYIHNPSISILV